MRKNIVLITFLSIYCLVTLAPFYLLVVRSFTPTIESTQFHLLIPERRPLSMNARIGDLATIYNVNLREFRREMGISGYMNPQLTLTQIAETYDNVTQEDIRTWLEPLVHYNGIYAILNNGFLTSLFGTIFVTGVSVIVGGLLGIMTGSVLAGFRSRWHLFVYNSYLLNMIIPPMMVILPQYLIMTRVLGLGDSYWSVILLHIKGGALSTMVFTSYIATIPKELREAVQMDGGKHYHYFLYVLLPLMGTPFAVFASITMPWFWNDLLHPLVLLSPEKYTLPAFIASIGGTFTTNFEAIFTGVLFSLMPILIVYLVFQKLFIRSAMAGAVKG
ncbi:MAG: carbohydrate ABC transporter permease [Hyphomicrobiales bacterium]|jgi:ABC-type glycerol-3-phosphate transport system permease component